MFQGALLNFVSYYFKKEGKKGLLLSNYLLFLKFIGPYHDTHLVQILKWEQIFVIWKLC